MVVALAVTVDRRLPLALRSRAGGRDVFVGTDPATKRLNEWIIDDAGGIDEYVRTVERQQHNCKRVECSGNDNERLIAHGGDKRNTNHVNNQSSWWASRRALPGATNSARTRGRARRSAATGHSCEPAAGAHTMSAGRFSSWDRGIEDPREHDDGVGVESPVPARAGVWCWLVTTTGLVAHAPVATITCTAKERLVCNFVYPGGRA